MQTKKFTVFIPVEKRYYTYDYIYNRVCIASLALLGLCWFLSGNNHITGVWAYVAGLLALAVFLPQLLLGFTNGVRYAPLKGKLEGSLWLHDNFILVNGIKYIVQDLQKLEISMYDYKGRVPVDNSKSLDGRMSYGIGNSVTLYFADGLKEEFTFSRKHNLMPNL